MTRYFFHLVEGDESFPDTHGMLCHSRDEAVERALKDARAIMAEELLEGRLRLDQRITVSDSEGRPIYNLEFEDAFSVTRWPTTFSREESGTAPFLERAVTAG